jgi:hypothetical protein
MVSHHEFTPEWIRRELVGLMADSERRGVMGLAMGSLGVRDGAEQVAQMACDAAGRA